MLHKLLEEGDWFAAKRYGYGAGLPIAWQGWAVLAAYLALVMGLAMAAEATEDAMLPTAGIIAATIVFVVIVYRRTRGGWRWQWGERD